MELNIMYLPQWLAHVQMLYLSYNFTLIFITLKFITVQQKSCSRAQSQEERTQDFHSIIGSTETQFLTIPEVTQRVHEQNDYQGILFIRMVHIGKDFPVHAMNTHRGSRGTALLILNLGNRWR